MESSKRKEPTVRFNPTPTTKSLLKKEKSVEEVKKRSSLSLLSSSSSKKNNKVVGNGNAAAEEAMPKQVNKRRSRLFSSSLERSSPSHDSAVTKKTPNKLQKRKSALSIDDLFAKHTST